MHWEASGATLQGDAAAGMVEMQGGRRRYGRRGQCFFLGLEGVGEAKGWGAHMLQRGGEEGGGGWT